MVKENADAFSINLECWAFSDSNSTAALNMLR